MGKSREDCLDYLNQCGKTQPKCGQHLLAESQIKDMGEWEKGIFFISNIYVLIYLSVCLFAYFAFTVFGKFINPVIVTANSFIDTSSSFFRCLICTEDPDDSPSDVITSFVRLLARTENQQLSRNPHSLGHLIGTEEAPNIMD